MIVIVPLEIWLGYGMLTAAAFLATGVVLGLFFHKRQPRYKVLKGERGTIIYVPHAEAPPVSLEIDWDEVLEDIVAHYD